MMLNDQGGIWREAGVTYFEAVLYNVMSTLYLSRVTFHVVVIVVAS